MRILAVDTTGPIGSIALIDDSGVMEEVSLGSSDGFAHVVFGAIDTLLQRHGIGVTEIDGFAAASGPGSFTGVRVGLSTVKGLAEATGKKVVAVSNLKALAYFGTEANRAAVIDARRGEIFAAVYDAALNPVRDEVVIKLTDWLTGLNTFPEHSLELITQGDPLAVPMEAAGIHAHISQAPMALAGAIGQIAIKELRQGLGLDPADVDANYVRRSDAELLWRESDTAKPA